MPKTPICLHFHIFKNAGTTIDWILKKNFGSDHLSMDDQAKHPAEIFPWDRVLSFLEKHPNAKSFSSHIIRFPIPDETLFNFLPMVSIRHPLDRAFSIYSFKKRDNDNVVATLVAKTGTLKEFIEWNLNIKKYTVMKNFQTQYLSRNHYDFIPFTENDYLTAIKNIEKCQVVGIVDRLDESLVVAEESLRFYFDKIDMSYLIQNVSSDRKENMHARLDDGKEKIGELYTILEKQNEFDFKLYDYVNKKLDTKIQQISNFESKLTDFKNRCKKLKKF